MWVNNIELENLQEMEIYGYSKFIDLYNCSQRQKIHENHIIVKKRKKCNFLCIKYTLDYEVVTYPFVLCVL